MSTHPDAIIHRFESAVLDANLTAAWKAAQAIAEDIFDSIRLAATVNTPVEDIADIVEAYYWDHYGD